MKIRAARYITLLLLLHSFSSSAQTDKITVAVAANMQYAFQELQQDFENRYHIQVAAVIGASGNLTTQILQGAPFDVFISADTSYPSEIYAKGLAWGKPRIYARGALVLWTTRGAVPLQPDLRFLLSNNIKSIALANPRIAPYGMAAEALLKKYGLLDRLQGKLVFGESISQTSQFIASGNADAGFTAKAVVLSNEMARKGRWEELNSNDYPPIYQSAVLLQYGHRTHPGAAARFFTYLFSPTAMSIYKKYGYLK